MVALRHLVLRAPLGLAFTAAELDAEAGQLHLALRTAGRLDGTLVMLPPDAHGCAKLRQMAIRPGRERAGLGARLVRHGEGLLRGLGAGSIRLAARETAIGFYERLGYAAEGDRFLEVTLPHRLMRRRLDSVPA